MLNTGKPEKGKIDDGMRNSTLISTGSDGRKPSGSVEDARSTESPKLFLIQVKNDSKVIGSRSARS